MLPVATTIQSKGRLLNLSQPVVMGILNATPNSFYNKGQASEPLPLLSSAEIMLKQGAAILDIGGASTKPGEPLIDPATEAERILPAIELIHHHFPEAWISVDTYNASVAAQAVAAGADIVNDVSGGQIDGAMLSTVAGLKVPYIAMHMQGVPETMQADPRYTNVVTEVREYLRDISNECSAAGIVDLIVDPGFGFGKTLEHNYSLLRALHTFSVLGRPLLIGLSRKSMVCKALRVDPAHALNGTTALNMFALLQGCNILRVHDVKEAIEVIKLAEWVSV